jgi:hypothetical protein
MSEQLGTGIEQQRVTLGDKPTINVASVTVTTAADAAIAAILLALKNLGLIDSDAA